MPRSAVVALRPDSIVALLVGVAPWEQLVSVVLPILVVVALVAETFSELAVATVSLDPSTAAACRSEKSCRPRLLTRSSSACSPLYPWSCRPLRFRLAASHR